MPKNIAMPESNNSGLGKALGHLLLCPARCTFVGQTVFPFAPGSLRVD